MKAYVVLQDSVYRHRLIGVYSSLHQAIGAGVVSVTTEHDHFHDALILEIELDAPADTPEVELGYVTAEWAEGTTHVDRRDPAAFKRAVWIPASAPVRT